MHRPDTCELHEGLERKLEKMSRKINSCLLLLSFASALGLIQVTGMAAGCSSSHNITAAAPPSADGGDDHGD